MVLVKLRAKIEDKVKNAAESLCASLKDINKSKDIEIISVNPSNPARLRGNYYWQVLIRCSKVIAAAEFLRNSLKNFRHSGIIVTVDVDPV
jgi:primosomal protein N'